MSRRAISGSRAIVTGASSGIGRALACELHRQGADLILSARREDRLAQLADQLQAEGQKAVYRAGDITDPNVRAELLEAARNELDGLDLLINNAGVGAIGAFAEADEARLRRVMEVNFFAPAELMRGAIELLQNGRQPMIVNISSVLGHRAVPLKSEYCASKFALHGLSDSVRAELADSGIDLLLVSPSTTKSEFFDSVLENSVLDNSASKNSASKNSASKNSASKNSASKNSASTARAPEVNASPPSTGTGAMSVERVARQTVRAIRRGRHEIILSPGGKLLVWLDRLSPPLVNRLIARFG